MITMSEQELYRVQVLERVIHGTLRPSGAARQLEVSSRQIRRLLYRYKADGAAGLVHQLRDRASNRKLDAAIAQQAQQLIGAHYRDFGPTLACETLAERHGIALSIETVRRLMCQAGLWKVKRQHTAPIHPMRERRARRGELIQIDGSLHDWFEGRSPRCSLLVFIDDATSELMALRFVPRETTHDYMQTLREHIFQHGLPMCLYSDRHNIFRTSNTQDPQPTQFAMALERLGIEGIHARSPQAKGRVERANQTLQDRLIKAMRLAGIDDIEAANAWVGKYIQSHNRRFAVAATEPEDAHVAYLDDPETLDLLLAHYEERTLSKTLSCQFQGQILQINAPTQQRRLAGKTVQIIKRLDGVLFVMYDKQSLPYTAMAKQERVKPVVDAKALNDVVERVRMRPRPAANHPWKRWQGTTPNPNPPQPLPSAAHAA